MRIRTTLVATALTTAALLGGAGAALADEGPESASPGAMVDAELSGTSVAKDTHGSSRGAKSAAATREAIDDSVAGGLLGHLVG